MVKTVVEGSIDIDSLSSLGTDQESKELGIVGLWNPDLFANEIKYLFGKHRKLVQKYVKDEFSNNADRIRVNPTNLVKRLVNSAANVYKKPPTRIFKGGKVDNMVESALNYSLISSKGIS